MINQKYLKWINKNIHTDLTDRVIFISGGNSGIGFETTRFCLYLKMKVIWGCRNENKALISKNKILEEFPNACLDIVKLDLADLSTVRMVASFLKPRYEKIDYLYNNAGVYRLDKDHTKDGYDLTIGTNVIGTYVLTNEFISLYPNIKVILTSSITTRFANIDYSDFQMDKKYSKAKAYSNSKLMTNHLYLHYINTNENNNFNIVHPGGTYTPLIQKGYKNKVVQVLGKGFMKIFFHSPSKASLCSMYALNDDVNKCYIGPRGLFGLSGYPKIKKMPRKSCFNYQKTIESINKLI